MKIKKLKIAAAVAVALSCSTAHAITGDWGSITADKVASQRLTTFLESVAGADAVLTITDEADGSSLLALDDIVTITISGAKFNRTALGPLTPHATATSSVVTFTEEDATVVPAVETGVIWNLDATDTILTLPKITVASTANKNVILTIDTNNVANILDLTGVSNGTDVTFKVEVTRNLVGLITAIHDSAESGTVVAIDDFVTAAVATPSTGTITVTSGFKELDGTTSVTSATAGDFVTKINDADPTDATGTGIVTISGNMTGVTEIDITTPTDTGTQSACDATGASETATGSGELFIDYTANKAYYCLDNAAIEVVQTIDPLFTFDGTTALAPREYSIGIDYIEGTSDEFSAFSVAEISAITLTRDGSSFSVTASGKKNKIKITDMSGSADAAVITITAYDASGAEITGTYVTPVLEANATVTIDMNDVVPLYTGAVRYDFIVESTEIIASNVKKHDLGVTAETYRNTTTIGETSGTTTTTKAGSGAL